MRRYLSVSNLMWTLLAMLALAAMAFASWRLWGIEADCAARCPSCVVANTAANGWTCVPVAP